MDHILLAPLHAQDFFLREKSGLISEVRTFQQVKVNHPAAVIEESCKQVPMPADITIGQKTYAAAVRGITTSEDGNPSIILPRPRNPPKKKRMPRQQRPVTFRRSRVTLPRRRVNTKAHKTLTDLSSLSGLLSVVSPELAKAIETITEVLQPLLALLPLVEKLKRTSS